VRHVTVTVRRFVENMNVDSLNTDVFPVGE